MKKLLHNEILLKRLTLEQAKSYKRHPIALLAVDIRSLYNIGSLFRTADSALASELVLCGFTPHPPRAEIEKTALGAVDTVPWKYFKTKTEAVDYLKSKGYKIVAVEITDKQRSYDTLLPVEFPLCLVLGNELTGLDDEIMSICDDAIEIPMYGVKHSLNVSVAAGIVLFEAVKIFRNTQNL